MMTKKPTCFELRAALERMGVSYPDFAKLCGVTFGTVDRWCEGRMPIPKYVWTVISLMANVGFRDLIRGAAFRFELNEEDVFPEGYSREEYIRLMKRFHPDRVKKRNRDFIGEVQVLNEIKERYRRMKIEVDYIEPKKHRRGRRVQPA